MTSSSPWKRVYLPAALIGAAIGSATAFVYFNLDPFERMAAAADGFPQWSLWGLPFTAPEAALGALTGVVVVFVTRLLRNRAHA